MILLQKLAYRGCLGIEAGIVEADLILRFRTEEQKKRFIPHMLRGGVKRAVGMGEPEARRFGLGLASAQAEHRGMFRRPRS